MFSSPVENRGIRITAVVLLLVSATLMVFGNAGQFEFIRYDDEIYVTKNAKVLAGLTWEGLQWAFTTLDAGFWHPLTWLSLMADREIYGAYAGGYHWTSVLLHLASGLLLFGALVRMTGSLWRSGCVAGLFLLHPLHVEPVAWVGVRKDVLSAFFWMAGLWAYARYAEMPSVGRYLWLALLFLLGLMSKPMLVTFPLVLLLLDDWPLGRMAAVRQSGQAGLAVDDRGRSLIDRRFSRAPLVWLIGEKIPLLLLSAVVSVLAWMAERGVGALPSLEAMPLSLRLDNALVSYVRYLGKTLWPVGLAVFYPHPVHWPAEQVFAAAALLAAISLWVLYRSRKEPCLAVGWLWFLGTLVPVIGLVQVGSHAMADRYACLPLIGLFLMSVWGSGGVLRARPSGRRVMALMWGGILLALGICSWHQVQHWRDGLTLFSHAVAATPDNYLAHNNLGALLLDRGDYGGAAGHFRQALRIKPDAAVALNNLAKVLALQGQEDQAVLHLRRAIAADPGYLPARRNLADLLLRMGKGEEAAVLYRQALSGDPADPGLINNLGVALAAAGRVPEARTFFQEALRLKPDDADARRNLAILGGDVRQPDPSAPAKRGTRPGGGRGGSDARDAGLGR
jgi:Flp pilus assembly protein TadD